MAKFFKVGDHVSFKSKGGRVSGAITRVHLKRFQYQGRTHTASKDHPKYEIQLDETGHLVVQKGAALQRVQK